MAGEEWTRQAAWSIGDAARAWDPSAHPRAPAGSSAGGQFAAGSGGAAPTNQHPVGEGESGQRVKDLQRRLNALGAHLAVDGKFGPKTLAAVRAFQKAHGLKVDGLVGPKTTAALRGKRDGHKASGQHKMSGRPGSITSAQKAEIGQLLKNRKVPAADAADMQSGLGSMPEADAQALIKHLQGLPVSRALAHEPLGKPGGPGLWHDKHRQLPAYIQHIARDLMTERHMPESEAIATAVSMCKKWAAGGKDVHPDTRAKAAAAIAEWERLKAGAHARRSAPMSDAGSGGYDEDGLDASWDGDHSDLPSLTGLDVGDFEAVDDAEAGPPERASRAAKLGTGARFAKLKAALASKGASDPGALAAYIGRKKYGKGKFKQLASAARKRKGGGMSRSSIIRLCSLEDIHIVRRAEGDGSGRVVEAYAAVFDEPAEISDSQGHYEETIDRTAFDGWLTRVQRSRGGIAAAVRCLYNHGKTMEGVPAAEFQRPLGKPLEIRPEGRGLLTRTEYAKTPLAEGLLDDIKEGRITAQSFEGPVMRSDPELRGPGDRYRRRNGVLPRVRRMAVGMFNYGPALFAAYSGAEFLGVRMQLPGAVLDEIEDGPDYTEAEESAPGMVGDGDGGTPGDVTSPRHHHHQLLALRTAEMRREAGIGIRKVPW